MCVFYFIYLFFYIKLDQPRSDPLDRTVGQRMEGVNLAPVTTPYDKQGAKQKDKPSLKKKRGSKSNRGIRSCFSCFFVKGISLFVT